MKKNIILNLLIVVIVICCGLAVYFVWKSGVFGTKGLDIANTQETESVKSEIFEETTEISEPTESLFNTTEERSLTREDIMTYTASHISSLVRKISPNECSCGKWQVIRFGFTSDEDVYVEYEHNGGLAQILIHYTGTTRDVSINVQALFEPGADMWNLVKGQDTQFGKKIEFYEQNKEGKWVSIHQY